MCEALNLKKNDHTLGIIQNTYLDYDVIFLQEAAANFIELVSGAAIGLIVFRSVVAMRP